MRPWSPATVRQALSFPCSGRPSGLRRLLTSDRGGTRIGELLRGDVATATTLDGLRFAFQVGIPESGCFLHNAAVETLSHSERQVVCSIHNHLILVPTG